VIKPGGQQSETPPRASTEVSKYRKSQIEKYFIKEVHLYGKYLTEVLINHHTREFV